MEAKHTILVVDDEEIVLSLVRDALEDDSVDVITTENSAEALKIAFSKPVDVLLTDIRMPGMSGIELVEKVHEQKPEIRVVFMTGYANLSSAKNAIQQGAVDYVLKPFELREIRESVHKAIAAVESERTKVSQDKLSELSGLGKMLFSAGDKESMIASSLRFAMMHRNCHTGCMVYRSTEESGCRLLTIEHNRMYEKSLPETVAGALNAIVPGPPLVPALLGAIGEYAPLKSIRCADCTVLMPDWVSNETPMIIIPIFRPDFVFGLMLLCCGDDAITFLPSDREFLAIVANQLASTLENLELLDQAQHAYTRLKDLQDEQIELEKMATRGTMSAEIGHELNNFLGVVQGNISLIAMNLEKKQYDKLDSLLEKINTTVERMTRFTSNLMDLRQISSEPELLCFSTLLTEVVEYLSPQRRFRGIDIVLPESLEPMPLTADSTQLRQVLYNLFNNAADAMVNSEVRRIDVELEVDDKYLMLVVGDTGIGFDPSSLSRAFKDQFTTKEDGHGFGLVVCGRIIENHGGTVRVESETGKGTRIFVTLPLNQTVRSETNSLSNVSA